MIDLSGFGTRQNTDWKILGPKVTVASTISLVPLSRIRWRCLYLNEKTLYDTLLVSDYENPLKDLKLNTVTQQ